ncbi:polysaccharide deacetylase family protein [Altererythrobacter luteolus]|uniref:Chitooligosaccharide deacetylase n=1 Tax=Pontixanthobacter luteolus TaxID=295089 RepID=A0A6I4V104_9SPHN|nr:polysaccharide deacetylase family protein [Pontixanthobacter luteolus]MXP47949.1 polysaccharide deacetylase family protein [Pontixanthobacter luteolus]
MNAKHSTLAPDPAGGSLVISLDCEGKWGLADCLTPQTNSLFSDEALIAVYRRLCKIFSDFDAPATFAFVATFLMTPHEAAKQLDKLGYGKERAVSIWLAAYFAQRQQGDLNGWHLPCLADIVSESGVHEIAAHGFSHLPLNSDGVSPQMARTEISMSKKALARLGHEATTYIYARNEIANVQAVGESGFLGFRSARLSRGRLSNFASEFSLMDTAEPFSGSHERERFGTVAIPAGRILNFHIGLRKLVPRFVTVRRWRSILDDAAERGGCAHLWFHPHNLISDPQAETVLRSILRHASNLRDSGKLRIETQASYAKERASLSSGNSTEAVSIERLANAQQITVRP